MKIKAVSMKDIATFLCEVYSTAIRSQLLSNGLKTKFKMMKKKKKKKEVFRHRYKEIRDNNQPQLVHLQYQVDLEANGLFYAA